MTRVPALLNVLAIGDSLTVGLYSSALNTAYWPLVQAAITAAFPSHAISYASSAVYGGTLAAQLASAYAWRTPAPDVVIVQTGENDSGLSDSAYRTAYDALLDAVQQGSRTPVLVCLGPWKGSAGKVSASQASCLAHGGTFVDLTSQSADVANSGPADVVTAIYSPSPTDSFHPNDTGHAAIKAALWAALRPLLPAARAAVASRTGGLTRATVASRSAV